MFGSLRPHQETPEEARRRRQREANERSTPPDSMHPLYPAHSLDAPSYDSSPASDCGSYSDGGGCSDGGGGGGGD